MKIVAAETNTRPTIIIMNKWLSLSEAAKYLDCSPDTILRRAVPWNEKSVSNRIRYKHLKLDEDTRRERRYRVDDLDAMMVLQSS
jgi:hypothetical protein